MWEEKWNVVENEYRERVIMLCSKVINGREKVEHQPPPLLFLPSDAETVLLGATAKEAGEREREENLESSW